MCFACLVGNGCFHFECVALPRLEGFSRFSFQLDVDGKSALRVKAYRVGLQRLVRVQIAAQAVVAFQAPGQRHLLNRSPAESLHFATQSHRLAQTIGNGDGLEGDFERRALVFFHLEAGGSRYLLFLNTHHELAVQAGGRQGEVGGKGAEFVGLHASGGYLFEVGIE